MHPHSHFLVVVLLQLAVSTSGYYVSPSGTNSSSHWTSLSQTALVKRVAFYQTDASDAASPASIWVPVTSPATKRAEEHIKLRSISKRTTHAKKSFEYRSSGGITLPLDKPVPDESTHAVIHHIQQRNRALKRHALATGFDNDEDYVTPLLSHHYELERRGLSSGLNVITDPPEKRSTNNFKIDAAVVPNSIATAAIDQDGSDISYFSTIHVGSQQKAFMVVMDSGSSDLWIPAADCASAPCTNHATFGPSDSTTYMSSASKWKITYGSGAANGTLVQDTISIAGITTPPVAFGTASTLSSAFSNLPSDGIMGLGFASASAQKLPTLVDNLKSAGLIQRAMFAVNLQRAQDKTDTTNAKDGEISFGVINTSMFSGELVTTPNIATNGLWEAKIDGLYINGQAINIGTSPSGIIDTGTTLVLAPNTIATVIHAAIPNAQTDGTGSFSIPCTTTISIAIAFGGTQFSIDPRDYVGSPIDKSGVQCISNISGQQVGTASQFLIGDVFLKNVYTVFDADSNAIGFGAKDANAAATTTTTTTTTTNPLVAGARAVASAAAAAAAAATGSIVTPFNLDDPSDSEDAVTKMSKMLLKPAGVTEMVQTNGARRW